MARDNEQKSEWRTTQVLLPLKFGRKSPKTVFADPAPIVARLLQVRATLQSNKRLGLRGLWQREQPQEPRPWRIVDATYTEHGLLVPVGELPNTELLHQHGETTQILDLPYGLSHNGDAVSTFLLQSLRGGQTRAVFGVQSRAEQMFYESKVRDFHAEPGSVTLSGVWAGESEQD
jgi:hypothetical protein